MAVRWRVSEFPPQRTVPQPDNAKQQNDSMLSVSFWAYIVAVFINVAIEWSVIFWGAEFIEIALGLNSITATSLMTAFFIAMVIGRIAGSALSRRVASARLLLIALGIVLIGFPLFWLPRFTPLNILGLFIAGLGIANLFPLTLATASSAVPHHANLASARVSMASGLAILIAPQILGSMGDQVGIESAFGIVAALALAALAVTFAANRMAVRDPSRVESEHRATLIQ
jgi:fucose permease